VPIYNSFSILAPHLNGVSYSLGHGNGASLVVGLREPVDGGALKVLGDALGSVLRVGLILMPAVLDSPLGVLVGSLDVILGEGSDDDVGPLAGLRGGHLEGKTSLVGDLKSLLNIVEEDFVSVIRLAEDESVLGTNTEALGLAAATIGKSAEEALTEDVIPELLRGIIPNPFLETAASVTLAVEDKRGALVLLRLSVMHVEANLLLHGGSSRLGATGGPSVVIIGGTVALLNLELETNVGVKRDGLATERSLGVGVTPSVVSGAGNGSLGTLLELGHSKVPALEDLGLTDVEDLGEALALRLRVRDHSVIHEIGSPVDGGPIAGSAGSTGTGGLNVDTNSSKILGRRVVGVVLAVRAENVGGGALSHSAADAEERSLSKGNLHLI
jgi:hypothetical protein